MGRRVRTRGTQLQRQRRQTTVLHPNEAHAGSFDERGSYICFLHCVIQTRIISRFRIIIVIARAIVNAHGIDPVCTHLRVKGVAAEAVAGEGSTDAGKERAQEQAQA